MPPIVLSYNRKSGALKRSGAVIGRIDPAPGGFEATLYGAGRLHARDLPSLLAAVRATLTRNDNPNSQEN